MSQTNIIFFVNLKSIVVWNVRKYVLSFKNHAGLWLPAWLVYKQKKG